MSEKFMPIIIWSVLAIPMPPCRLHTRSNGWWGYTPGGWLDLCPGVAGKGTLTSLESGCGHDVTGTGRKSWPGLSVKEAGYTLGALSAFYWPLASFTSCKCFLSCALSVYHIILHLFGVSPSLLFYMYLQRFWTHSEGGCLLLTHHSLILWDQQTLSVLF